MKRETPPASTSRKMSKPKAVPAVPTPANVLPMPSAGARQRAASPAKGKTPPTPDAIALRAYQLFEARHFEHGHDLDDWLSAENELRLAAKPSRRKASA